MKLAKLVDALDAPVMKHLTLSKLLTRFTAVRSFAFFGTIVIIKTVIEFLLRAFEVVENNEDMVLLYPAMDIFEALLTLYTLYCTFMFC